MTIDRLTISNFRNLKSIELSPHKRVNLFTGDNAQGKSNILEAIGLITTGRSFRSSNEDELISWNETYSRIDGEINNKKEQTEINLFLSREKSSSVRKRIKLNKAPVKRLSDFIGRIKAVIFSRTDLETITGPPLWRRKFLDNILSNISLKYLHNIQRYHLIVRERNNWLRTEKTFNKKNAQMAEIWEEQLSNYGSAIIIDRIELINSIESISLKIQESLLPDEQLEIIYKPSFEIIENNFQSIYSSFFKHFEEKRNIERLRKTTIFGPHRDDLAIMLNGKPVRVFGSQGQQRFISILLKLIEHEIIEEKTGENPITLLDDCFSELDCKKTGKLVKHLCNKGQVFITSNTVPDEANINDENQLYKVKEGRLFPLD